MCKSCDGDKWKTGFSAESRRTLKAGEDLLSLSPRSDFLNESSRLLVRITCKFVFRTSDFTREVRVSPLSSTETLS